MDISNLPDYFHELWELSRKAAFFPWKSGTEDDLNGLAEELGRMLELMEKNGGKEIAFEYFCREMLAEYSPDNAAYYVSPVCSQDSSIRKHAWPFYSVLRNAELAHKPLGVTQAALTVCASMGVACRKTLEMLNAESANKALPPPPQFGSTHPAHILLAKMKPEDRRAALYVVR